MPLKAKYSSPKEMEKAIQNYFDKLGDQPPAVTDLALALGFCDRQSLQDYKAKQPYSSLIKKAVSRIVAFHERRMTSQSCAGSIFWLKNYGFSDSPANVQSPTFSGPLKIQVELVSPESGKISPKDKSDKQ